MRKSIISLLLLALFSVHASCSFANGFLNAIASKNGEAKIAKDEYGLYVEFDVAEEPIQPEDTTRMLLSFTSPNTLLSSKDCLGFEEYKCGSHNCKPGKDEVDVIYPFFTARAFPSTIEGYLDRKAWILRSNTFYTLTCASGSHNTYGKNRTGVVGFGLENNSTANYNLNNTDKTYFSVALKNPSEGTLYFNTQKSLAAGKPITFKTTSAWKSEAIESVWYLGTEKAVAAVSVIFDIHADAIGLPDSLYKPVLELFKKYGVTACPEDIFNKPECTFTGNVTELPALVFHHQSQNITIPKELYLKDAKTEKPEKIQFNFKEMASTHEGPSYIHESYVNTIVLDSNFMAKFYTVFKQGAIEIYGAGSENPSTDGGSGIWKWVGIGAAVVVVAVGAFLFVKSKKSSSDDYSRE